MRKLVKVTDKESGDWYGYSELTRTYCCTSIAAYYVEEVLPQSRQDEYAYAGYRDLDDVKILTGNELATVKRYLRS